MNDVMNEWQEREKRERKEAAETIKDMLSRAKESGLSGEIRVHFDGYGDDGSMDLEEAPEGFEEWCAKNNVYPGWGETKKYDAEKREWVAIADAPLCLFNRVDALIEGDWVNNSGGWGDVSMNIDTGSIKVEMNERYEDSEYSEQEF